MRAKVLCWARRILAPLRKPRLLPRGSPAVRGHSVCRLHGAGGGAPRGNKNAFKHGLYTAEALETRAAIARLTKQARELAGMA